MADLQEIGFHDDGEMYKVSGGGVRFKMRTAGLTNPELILAARHNPKNMLYKLKFGHQTQIYRYFDKQDQSFPSPCCIPLNDFKEYYLTWHSNKITVGLVDQEPFLQYVKMASDPVIGYILFKSLNKHHHFVEWVFENSPVILEPITCKKFSETLHWSPMIGGQLPPDAMIGGFDNELIYIARADHNGSLCPGKYVPSAGKAYVAWGHREHPKENFEILCGFNAKWVKTRSNCIPQNAFIGGYSEVNDEPLYIGRGKVQGKLICGKVHVLYKTCYLPYQGREVEVYLYEILAIPEDEVPQAHIPYGSDQSLPVYLVN